MRKILYVVTKSSWGGAQRYVYDLATGLDPAAFDIAVALGGTGPLADRLKTRGIRVVQVAGLGRDVHFMADARSFTSLLGIIRRERPAILHLNSSKIGILGAVAGRIMGVRKIVFTSHGWAFNEKRSLPSRLLFKCAHWLTVTLSHITIANSKSTARGMEGLPFTKDKIRVIYPGRDAVKLAARATAREHILNTMNGHNLPVERLTDKEVVWIGTIAELNTNKGLSYLIEAMDAMRRKNVDAAAIIMGDGDEYDNLLYMIKSMGLTDRVFLAGFIPDAARLLKAFDIFVLPSVTESFGYTLVEAGQAGHPVVASNVGGIPEIIENGKNGILRKPRDVEGLAWAIGLLAANPAKRKALGENLKQKVERDFTLERMIKETVKIYEAR